MSFIEFMKNNFLHILPILAAGAFALAIIIERSRALLKTYPLKSTEVFFDKVSDLIMANKLNEVVALCDRTPNKPTAQVVKQAVLRAHLPENVIESGISIAVGEAAEIIQKRTSFLATIANVATLLGLFGTIAGLVHSFEAVGHADAQQKAALLAQGISTAMNATMMGLGVAIPCMIAFSFLINKTNKLMSNIDQAGVRIMDILKLRFYSAECEVLNAVSAQAEDDEEEMAPIKRTKKSRE